MRKFVAAIVAGAGLLTLVGCGANNVVGHEITRNGSFYDDFRVWGNDNVVTVDRYSNLRKLGIKGDRNQIVVEEGARLLLIEIFGHDNVVSIPDNLIVPSNEVGHRNQIIHRPHERQVGASKMIYRPLPRDPGGRIMMRVTRTNDPNAADVTVKTNETVQVQVVESTPTEADGQTETTIEPVDEVDVTTMEETEPMEEVEIIEPVEEEAVVEETPDPTLK